MRAPRAVREENEYLRGQLGMEHGYARYQWAWSSDLTMPMVMVDANGKPELDFFCGCGKNVNVHRGDCRTFSIPKTRWEVRNFCPEILEQWVLCRWQPPEASRDDWANMFPGHPYPASGYLIPVGDKEKVIRIPSGQVPFRATSEEVVRAVKSHEENRVQDYVRQVKEKQKAHEEKYADNLLMRIKDRFPVHEGFPGKKENWSHGGMPEAPSPVLRKEESCLQQ